MGARLSGPAPPGPAGDTRPEQRSAYVEYLPWAVLNAALVVVTFNVYLFWAKCNVRRYLWGTTWIGNHPLIYTGNGRNLAVGFALSVTLLIAVLGLPLAILVSEFTAQLQRLTATGGVELTGNALLDVLILVVLPLSWSLLGLLLAYSPQVSVPLPVVVISAATVLLGWFYALSVSRCLAFRHLLRHTRWQGVSGDIGGSPWVYGRRMLWPELSRWLTLGWTGPWRYMLRWERLFENARFGSARLSFKGRARQLYLRFALVWAGLVALWWALSSTIESYADAGSPDVSLVANLATLVAFLILVPMVAWYNELAYRHVAASLSLGKLRFRFTGTWHGLTRLYLTNLIMNVLSVGLAYYYTRMRIARFVIRNLVIEGDLQSVSESTEARADTRARFAEGLEALVAASHL